MRRFRRNLATIRTRRLVVEPLEQRIVLTAVPSISGVVFNDINQDGVLEPADGETPAAGRMVFLDLNTNGRLDSPQEPSVVTSSDGTYKFEQLPPGAYSVVEAASTDFWQVFPAQSAPSTRLVDVATNDLVFDSNSGKIYASTTSSDASHADSIVAIDPTTGAIVNSIGLGGTGGKLAVSDNGQYLYVAMDGAVQRIDLATLTLGLKFSIETPLQVEDIEVMPGHPGTVAIERYRPGFSPRDEYVAIYEDGVKRPEMTGGSNVIEFADTPNKLYGYQKEITSFEFSRISVTPSGVSRTFLTGDLVSGFDTDIEFDGGRIYTTNGLVVDPEAAVPLGQFQASGSVEPVSRRGLTFFLSENKLRAFDQQTFLPVGELVVPGVSGSQSGLIQWGSKGLSFRTDNNRLVLVEWNPRSATHEVSLNEGEAAEGRNFGNVNTANPGSISGTVYLDENGGGTKDPGEAGLSGWTLYLDQNSNGQFDNGERTAVTDGGGNYSFPGLAPGDYFVGELSKPLWQQTSPGLQQGSLRQIDLVTTDIVYSSVTGKIYAAVPSSVEIIGNSIAVIDPTNGRIVSTLFVGSDPTKLAVSDDGRYLYVALNGAKAVQRVNLSTLTLDIKFSTNPLVVADMEVVPGNANSVAVTSYDPRFFPGGDAAAIYDDGVRRLQTAAATLIAFSSDSSVLYALEGLSTSLKTFRRLTASAAGVSLTDSIADLFEADFEFAGGRIYATDGKVIDPETRQILGQMGNGSVEADLVQGVTYYINNGVLSAYDQKSFVQVASNTLPNVKDTTGLIRWGSEGLATRTPGQIVLVTWNPASAPGNPTLPIHVSSGMEATGRHFGNRNTGPANPPTTLPDAFTGFEDQLLSVPVKGFLSNDTDSQNAALTAALVVGPKNGTLSFRFDGSFNYSPKANFNGTDSFTYRASNNEALSEVTTVTLNITPVNDAPNGGNRSNTIAEDSTLTLSAANFVISDPVDSPRNVLKAVRIASLPAVGTLTYDGDNVAAGDIIPSQDISAGQLRYRPPENANGSALARFTYQAQDDGGTADGGVDLDPTSNTVTINVTPVNDSPTFLAGSDQLVTDRSGPQNVDGWAGEILPGPANESGQQLHFELFNSNESLFAVQPVVDLAGTLTFEPKEGVSGTAEISVVLVDDGGTASGGRNRSETHLLMIQVTKEHLLHNPDVATDVTGDGKVAADDALAIINYINAFSAGPIGPNELPQKLFYDVTGDDYIAADDVITVINYINAHPSQPEVPTLSEAFDNNSETVSPTLNADLIDLLASANAEARLKRRR